LDIPAAGTVAVAVVGDSAGLTLPVDTYLWSTQESRTLHAAETRLVEQCLARFHRRLPATTPPSGLEPETTTSRRYGLTSPTQAAEYGYRLPAALTQEAPAPVGVVSAADRATVGVIEGSVRDVEGLPVPAGGCAQEAADRLGGGRPVGVQDIPQDVDGAAWRLSRADPHVQAAFRAWALCMNKQGFEYSDPMGPMNDARFVGTPGLGEKAVAKADVACKRTSNVAGTWYVYDVEYQRLLIHRNAQAMRVALDDKGHQLQVARRVLAAG